MAQFAVDSFGGTPGTGLSTSNPDWVQHPAYSTGACIISSANRLRRSNNNNALYYHSGTPASADYEVSCVLVAKETDGGASNTGITGRTSTTANTFYHARYSGSTTDGWQLYKFVAGTPTQLGSTISESLADESSSALRLRMVGTTIELYKLGESTPAISVTDSSISAAGKAGVRFVGTTETDTTGLHIDDFSADDIGGTTAVTSDLAQSFAVIASVQTDLAQSFAAVNAVQADLAQTFTVVSSVQADLAQSFGVVASVQADLAQTFDVIAEVQADLAQTFGIVNAVQADLAQTFGIVNTAESDLAQTFGVVNTVESDFAQTFGVVNTVESDLAQTFGVKASVQSDLEQAFDIDSGTSVTSDLAQSFGVVASVQVDLSQTFGINAVVQADLDQSFGVVNAVQADLDQTFAVNAAAQADLAQSFGVVGSVQADLAQTFGINGTVTSDLAQTFSISAPGSGASVEEIWQHVIEGGHSAEEMLRIILAAVTGRTTGIGTPQERYLSVNGTKARIVADFDADFNRVAVEIDGS